MARFAAPRRPRGSRSPPAALCVRLYRCVRVRRRPVVRFSITPPEPAAFAFPDRLPRPPASGWSATSSPAVARLEAARRPVLSPSDWRPGSPEVAARLPSRRCGTCGTSRYMQGTSAASARLLRDYIAPPAVRTSARIAARIGSASFGQAVSTSASSGESVSVFRQSAHQRATSLSATVDSATPSAKSARDSTSLGGILSPRRSIPSTIPHATSGSGGSSVHARQDSLRKLRSRSPRRRCLGTLLAARFLIGACAA